MPTMIHSTEHTKRGSSSIDLQSLLVCLVIVFACIVTSFGLAKLTELLRTRRRDQSNEVRRFTAIDTCPEVVRSRLQPKVY